MAFNAGSIEATLTINRNPFTAGLKAARAEAIKWAKNDIEVKIQPRLDQEGLTRIRNTLNRTVGRVIVRPVFDREAFTRIKNTIDRTVGRVTVRPNLDREAFQRIRNTIDRTVGRVTIRPSLDREAFERIRNTINRSVGRIQVRLDLDMESVARVRAVIEAMRPVVTVRIRYDRDNLEDLIRRMRDLNNNVRDGSNAFRNYGDNADRAFGRMGRQARLILMLMPLLLPVAGSAIVGLTGLIGGLVSALSIAALGVGAFALVAVPAFKKVKDAVAAGQAEINKLPPGLRQAANAMQTFNKAYETLQKQTEGGVGFAMAAGFNAATVAIRTLNPLINATSRAAVIIGNMAAQYFGGAHWRGFVTFLSNNMVPVLTKLFEIIAYGTRGVMNLIVAFKPFTDWMLDAMVRGMKDFANWTSTLSKNQAFIRFLDVARDSLSALMRFLGNTIDFLFQLSVALAPLGNIIMDTLGGIFRALANMPPEWLAAIAQGFFGIVSALILGASGPVAVFVGVLFGLAAALASLYQNNENVRRSVDSLINTLRTGFQPIIDIIATNLQNKIIPAWNELVELYRSKLEPILQRLFQAFQTKIMPVLAEIAETVTGNLIPAFLDFMKAIEPFVTFMVEQVGGLAVDAIRLLLEVFDQVLKTIASLFKAFSAAFRGDWDTFWKEIGGIFEGWGKLIVDEFSVVWGDLTTTLGEEGQIWKDEWDALWRGAGTTLEEEYKIWQDAWNSFWGGVIVTQEGKQVIVKSEWQRFLDDVYRVAQEEWAQLTGSWDGTWDQIITTQDGRQKTVKGSWTLFWEDLGRTFNAWVVEVIAGWLGFWNGTNTTQQTEQAKVKTNWDTFLDYMNLKFGEWGRTVSNSWSSFWGGVITQQDGNQVRVTGSWNTWLFTIASRAITMWEQIKKTIGDAMNWIRGVIDVAVALIGLAWRRMGNQFRAPIQWIIDVVLNRGILGSWNAVMGWIGAPALSARPIGALPAFAAGGPVMGGPGSKANTDSVRAWLMPGEYVFSKRAIANMGGLGAVDQIHQSARKGFTSPLAGMREGKSAQALMRAVPGDGLAFAYGGVQPHVASAGAEIERVFGRLPGGIGGVGSRATPSDHPSGLALDLMTLGNVGLGTRIADYLYSNAARMALKYEIFRQRIRYPNGGWTGMADRGSPTQNHMDHVHASFTGSGGPAGGLPALIQQVVSWWSQVGSRATSLFQGLIPGSIPGIGGPVGTAALSVPQKIMPIVIDALRKKLESLFTTITVQGSASAAPQITGPVQSIVRQMSAAMGWEPYWGALYNLIQGESGWNPNAANPTSSARGLFQKMTSIHGPIEPTVAGQAQWGLNYIKTRYGNPSIAYSRWLSRSPRWYGDGGWFMPGDTGYNETREPEAIFNRPQLNAMTRAMTDPDTLGGGRGISDERLVAIVRAIVAESGKNIHVSMGDVYNPVGEPAVETLVRRARVAADMGIFGED